MNGCGGEMCWVDCVWYYENQKDREGEWGGRKGKKNFRKEGKGIFEIVL